MSGHPAEVVALAFSAAAFFFACRSLITIREIRRNVRDEYRARVLAALDEMIAYTRLHEQEHEAKGESEAQFDAIAQGVLVGNIRDRIARL